MQPDLQRCLSALKNNDETILQEVIDKLPAWKDSLRSVQVKPMEEGLQAAVAARFKVCKKEAQQGQLEPLEALRHLALHAAEVLRPPSTDEKQTVDGPFAKLAADSDKALKAATEAKVKRKMADLLKDYLAQECRKREKRGRD